MQRKISVIVITFMLSASYAYAQCSEDIAKTTKGNWRPIESKIYIEKGSKATASLAPTLIKKAEHFRTFFEIAYPNPIGCDVRSYATLREYPNIDFPIGAGYAFEMSLIEFYCDRDTKKITPNEYTGSSGAEVYANTFELFLDAGGTGKGEGVFNINDTDVTVYMLPKSIGTIKGYKVYGLPKDKTILYTHDGKLPFKTITREQFLQALLKKMKSVEPSVNTQMAEIEANFINQLKEVDKSYTGEMREQMKAELQRGLEEIKRQKKEVGTTSSTFSSEESMNIEKYLKTHTAEELKKPASVRVTDVFRGFFTEEEEGHYLVVKDNTYMKKNLPALVAQMIILKWNSTNNKVSNDFMKKLEANFPFEKIQMLIDK